MLLLVLDVHSHPWSKLIPDGKEALYNYNALVKAGTGIPTNYFSTFKLDGKLHVQFDDVENSLLLRFADFEYSLQNGKESDEERKKLQLDTDKEVVTKPFKINYDPSGEVISIETEQNEPEYSVNMKKATGLIMQLNFEKVKLDSVKPYSFINEEMSAHGRDELLYNVIPAEDKVIVKKLHEMKSSDHLYMDLSTYIRPVKCEGKYEEIVTHDNQKSYTFLKNGTEITLKRVESTGGIYNQPFRGQGDAQYVYVVLTMDLMSITTTSDKIKLGSVQKHDTVDYVFGGANIFEHYDDKASLVPKVEKLLSEVHEYLKEDQMQPQRPDFDKMQVIEKINNYLLQFDEKMLRDLRAKLLQETTSEDDLSVLYHLLKFVGTQDSVDFLLTLIKENKLKEDDAIEVLQRMPFHIRYLTDEMVTKLEYMLHLNVTWPVQKASILSFSNILNKFHSTRNLNRNTFSQSERNDHHVVKDDKYTKRMDMLKNYITKFVDKIKTSQSVEEQYLYFDVLFNMEMKEVLPFLEPAIKGEWWDNNKLRLKAMLSGHMVADVDKIFELYSPILIDTHLPTELRIMALNIIFRSNPSISRLINVFWYMMQETDIELYQFYYSTLDQLAKNEESCMSSYRLMAKQLMKYTARPYLHGISHVRYVSLENKESNFGMSARWVFINTPSTLMFSLNVNEFMANVKCIPYSIYVRVMGLNMKFLDNFKMNVFSKTKIFNYDEIFKFIQNVPNMKDVEVEFITMENGLVVSNRYFDNANIKDIYSFYHKFISNTEKKVKIKSEYIQIPVQTDIGFPALFQTMFPTVEYISNKMTTDKTNNVLTYHFDNKYQLWAQGIYGVRIHNPLINAWHGIKKQLIMDVTLPIYGDISLNPNQEMIKLTWKRHEDSKDDIIGIKSYATNVVYLYDYNDKNLLSKSNPNSKPIVIVEPSEGLLHNVSITTCTFFKSLYSSARRAIKSKFYLNK